MIPMMIWSSARAATVQKYFTVARCEGVLLELSKGSVAGAGVGGSGSCFACRKAIKPMPPSNRMMLTPVQTTASPVGRLPTSGSCGQLLVYVTVSPGRLVDAAQDDQKKKAV